MKGAIEGEGNAGTPGVIASLRNTLHQAIQQNADLRSRLNKIHESSDLSDLSEAISTVSLTSKCVKLY